MNETMSFIARRASRPVRGGRGLVGLLRASRVCFFIVSPFTV